MSRPLRIGNVNDKEELAEIKNLLLSADLILDVIASKYQIRKSTLIKLGRGKDTFPRDLALYRIKQYRMDSLTTISGYFGNIHYSTVSNGIARAKRKIEKGGNYHRDLDDVKKSLLMLQKKT